MVVFHTINELQKGIRELNKLNGSVGFVPTMGALHKGHASLIERCAKENDITICSIFVNPTQFNDKTDLEKYPRTPEKDIALLQNAGCDILFMPSADEIYPKNETANEPWKAIDFGMLDKVMEGEHRPGHFTGVAQVVYRLFDIVKPHRAYFGQKDFQQLAIIKHMTNALQLPIEIMPCDIIREQDGLAMSSRNVRLTAEERKIAPKIYELLCKAKDLSKTYSYTEVKEIITKDFNAIAAFGLEYFEIADTKTLLPITEKTNTAIASVALKLGNVRLIDNVMII